MSGCGDCKNRWVKVSTKVDGVRNGWQVEKWNGRNGKNLGLEKGWLRVR